MSRVLYIGGPEQGIEIQVVKIESVPGLLRLADLIYWERHGDEISSINPLAQALGKTARAIKYSPFLEGCVHHLEIVNTVDDILDILTHHPSVKGQSKARELLNVLAEKGFVQQGGQSLERSLRSLKGGHVNELQLKTEKAKDELLQKLLDARTDTDGLSLEEPLFEGNVKTALQLADRLDEGIHRRFTQAPDICHLVRVAAIAARLSYNVSPEEFEYRVCLAFLHDCKENYTGEENVDTLILEEFGEELGGRLLIDLDKLTKKNFPKELKKLVEEKLEKETGLDFDEDSDDREARLNQSALTRLFRELSDNVYALGFEDASEDACFVKVCDVSANAEDTNEEMKINPLRRLGGLRGDGGPLLRYLRKVHDVIARRRLPSLRVVLNEVQQLLPERPCELPPVTRDIVLAERERQGNLRGFFFSALREVLEENQGAEWLKGMEASLNQSIPVLYPDRSVEINGFSGGRSEKNMQKD